MQSTASRFDVYMRGIIGFQDDESENNQFASIRSQVSNLPEVIYWTSVSDVELEGSLGITAFPSNNFTTNWDKVDTGNWTLSFGDEFFTDTPVTYTSRSEFSMNLQDNGAQIDGGFAGNADSMSGVFVSFNSSDLTEVDLYQSMPENTSYSTWGFWSLTASDAASVTDSVSASVNNGFWVGGEQISFSDLPTSGSASMNGAALMDVAYRYGQSGSNYGVQRYQTAADVAATFNWGSSSWSGTITVSNFDQDNPIVSNAGFTSFSFELDPSSSTFYGADSTDILDNAWQGGASVAGQFFGDTSPEQTGGTIDVNLYKSGSADTSGANDFYVAEGIYLLCISGGC
tara:strand:- start:753 stop:1781 length:1029 start_codon:yes stop_codon:yes gene_type:complete